MTGLWLTGHGRALMTHHLEAKIGNLEDEIEKLKRRVEMLEYEKHVNKYDFQKFPMPSCPRCGLKFEGTMGYVCTMIDCPTGLGPVIS